jgi:hypothetical protein
MLTVIIGKPNYDFSQLLPVLGEGWTKVFQSSGVLLYFPYLEIFYLIALLTTLKPKVSKYKTYRDVY